MYPELFPLFQSICFTTQIEGLYHVIFLKRAGFVDRRLLLRLKSYYRPDFHEIARAHMQHKFNSGIYIYYQETISCVRPRTSFHSVTSLQFPPNAYYIRQS